MNNLNNKTSTGIDDSQRLKADGGKPRWNLLEWGLIEGIVKVLTFGANKYASRGPCTCGLLNAMVVLRGHDDASYHSADCGVRTLVPADGSWRRVPNAKERYYSALMRHLIAWRQGEWLDAESGMPHLWHAACNVMFLYELDREDRGNS